MLKQILNNESVQNKKNNNFTALQVKIFCVNANN
jgi:hypothetical protein